jgi:4-alpha-glucanotransferase
MYHGRKSGILLHPTSLPGPGGIGSLGKEAYAFIDFLHLSGQSLWQVLPLGPTSFGDSPYSCYSAFAGNPMLIDLETIVAEGDLAHTDPRHDFPDDRVEYRQVKKFKSAVLKKAAANFFAGGDDRRRAEFENFREQSPWLHDYALFMTLKEIHHGKCWSDWPAGVAKHDHTALHELTGGVSGSVDEREYVQWQFFRQWRRVKEYANSRGIGIVGDIPIFVAYDSADVWTSPHLFKLDEKNRPTVVAGVPPDYFSETGQLWGNPIYDWDSMARDGYRWWIERFRSSLSLFDTVRVDHFRGFEAYWEVPKGEKTAVNGRWVKGPGEDLFDALADALGTLPIIAEDLGVITPQVEALRDRYNFPGMKILQFAFGSGPRNPYLPHNHIRQSVVYTGTHDNDTTSGWFSSISKSEKEVVCRYLGVSGNNISWDLIRAALVSVADTVIIPLQDVLSLGSETRMNTPGTAAGNWSWRCTSDALNTRLAAKLLDLTEIYGRRN